MTARCVIYRKYRTSAFYRKGEGTSIHLLLPKRAVFKMFWLISLTDNLQTPVSMKLADVSGAEPSLAFLIHEEVLTVLLFVLVVTHGYVGPAD